MRKIRIIGLSLVALFALGAFMASSAFAETEILVKAGSAAGKFFETEGSLELIKLEEGSRGILERIGCSGIFDGKFETATLGWIQDLLDLTGLITIGEKLTGEALNCEVLSEAGSLTDCKEKTLASLWVIGLNLAEKDEWHVELVLMTTAPEWLLVILSTNNLGGAVGYEVECESLIGIKGSEECTGAEPTFAASNGAGTPAGVFGEILFTAATTNEELANCTMTKEHTGAFEGSGTTWGLSAEGGTREETTLNK